MQSIHGVKYRFGRSTPNGCPANGKSGASFAADAGTLFNSNSKVNTATRPTNSVSVGNIPCHINRRDIVALFSTLIGEVRNFYDANDYHSPRLEITFVDRDAALKAMCMDGYTVDGTPLSVSILSSFISHPRGYKAATQDDRRNLYVLGLPFALSKAEFSAMFSQYGTVSHCVILATVDNSSRRRGFVVMSSHEEAQRAMTALTRTQAKGHSIDVSWAVVQRSQGFLDGGDRAVLLDSHSNMPSPSPAPFEKRQRALTSNSSDSSIEYHDADPTSLTTSYIPTTSLLVTNLPTVLFSQAQDLHPLLFPFGHIEKLEIVQVSPLGTISVLVQYSQISVAQEARESLSGQIYGAYHIDARFVRPATLTPFELRNNSAGDTTPSDNSGNAISLGYATSRPPSQGALAKQDGLILGPSNWSQSQSLNLAKPNLESLDNIVMSHSRQSSFSTKQSPFSNVFDDLPNSVQAPGYSSWNVNYSLPFGHQLQHPHHPLSKHEYCHTVFQTTA